VYYIRKNADDIISWWLAILKRIPYKSDFDDFSANSIKKGNSVDE